ncbi:MAG: caspase family protein [Thermodesulfobacteriota bacterium]
MKKSLPIRYIPIISIIFLILILFAGCQTPPMNADGSAATTGKSIDAAPGNAEDVLVVDCLLPGQMRKLGKMTYMTPRRPMKATALECEIRGGEYVAYDRSDYRTALGVWLPSAREGDLVAQNYVGEIYQKGVGGPPQYGQAAAWFEKAADQGYARAQLNLGFLYEKGLGVPKDQAKALNLYRQASGIEESISVGANDLSTAERQELEDLRLEIEKRREEVRSLRQQLENTQDRLDSTRHDYQWRMKHLEAERRGLARARAELEKLKNDRISPDESRLTALEAELNQREAALNAEQRQAAKLREQVASLEEKSQQFKTQLARARETADSEDPETDALRRELEQRKEEAAQLQAQLERTRKELERTRQDFQWQQKTIEDERKGLIQARSQLENIKQTGGAADQSEIRRLERELADREAVLRKQREEAERLKEQVADLDQTANGYRTQLNWFKDIRSEEQAKLEALQRQLEQRKAESELLRSQLDRTQKEMERTRREFDWQQKQMAAERSGLARVRQDFEQRKREDLTEGRAELERLEKEIARREARLEAQKREAQEMESEVARLASAAREYQNKLSEYNEQARDLPEPEIELIKPKVLATRSTKIRLDRPGLDQLQIVGKVTAPAGLYSLSINEKPETLDGAGLFDAVVQLEKVNDTEIHIIAVDRQGKRSDIQLMVAALQPQETEKPAHGVDFGAYHALIIGNNEYTGLPRLETAVNDARSIARMLQEKFGFKTRVLINADRFAIYTALDDYRKTLTERDNFLLYYAGHGELDQKNQRGYWLPVDASPESHVNSIPNYTVTDILNTMSVKQAIIVADTCYSGILTRAAVTHLETGMSPEKRLEMLKQMAGQRSRTVLSSGGLKPVLDAGSGDHSIFAGALLDVLGSSDDILEASRLYREIRARVSDMARQFGFEQVPQYAANLHAGHTAGDFLFVPVN